MTASTIDDVLAALRTEVARAIATNDRRGYFAALYARVTESIAAAIAAGEFEDGPRMTRLDVVFANRYLDALAGYEGGGNVSSVWRRAFDAAAGEHGELLLLPHIALGMNAHIAFDLGIAAATVAPGPLLPALATDFDRINTILASLVGTVEGELVTVAGTWSPASGVLLRLAERAARGREESAFDLLLAGTRRVAWSFARDLVALEGDARAARLERQDAEAALVSDAVIADMMLAARLAGAREDVAGNIRILASGELGAG